METIDIHPDPNVISRICRAMVLQTRQESLHVAVQDLDPRLDAARCVAIVRALERKLCDQGHDKSALAKFDTQTGRVGEVVCTKLDMRPSSIKDRCVGSLLGVLIGDVLGAPHEGGGYLRAAKCKNSLPQHFEISCHMGVESLGLRYGMYTDDGNATLAVAESLASKGALDSQHVAKQMAQSIFSTKPIRGCPDSAKNLAKHVLAGMPIEQTGRLQFPGGSFANGGAMKIAPVGLACYSASSSDIREAARLAVLSTHVHPEAVDGAAIIARCIAFLANTDSKSLNLSELLEEAFSVCETNTMEHQLALIEKHLVDDLSDEMCDADFLLQRALGADDFQIRALEAVPLVLWCFCRWYKTPDLCMVRTIMLGGDTDTTCSMVGGLCGALHGTSWIPVRWYNNLENGIRGRDYAEGLALQISNLNLSPKSITVTFQPEHLGIVRKGCRITKIEEGSQAEREGVQVGWRVKAVGSDNCNDDDISRLLEAAKLSNTALQVTFEKE